MGRKKKYENDDIRRAAHIWHGMKARCFNQKNPSFGYYGAVGVIVCDRWRSDFFAFLADMGVPPSEKHSIDRHPNNNGNYEPGNCRWATSKEQNRNRRTTQMITYRGKAVSAADWADAMGFRRSSVTSYITYGKMTASEIIKAETAKRARKLAIAERNAKDAKRKHGPLKGRTYQVGKCPICRYVWHYGPRHDRKTSECPHLEWHPSGLPSEIAMPFGAPEDPVAPPAVIP